MVYNLGPPHCRRPSQRDVWGGGCWSLQLQTSSEQCAQDPQRTTATSSAPRLQTPASQLSCASCHIAGSQLEGSAPHWEGMLKTGPCNMPATQFTPVSSRASPRHRPTSPQEAELSRSRGWVADGCSLGKSPESSQGTVEGSQVGLRSRGRPKGASHPVFTAGSCFSCGQLRLGLM